jgi:hypothetical protein
MSIYTQEIENYYFPLLADSGLIFVWHLTCMHIHTYIHGEDLTLVKVESVGTLKSSERETGTVVTGQCNVCT